jgi:hypothetical protein
MGLSSAWKSNKINLARAATLSESAAEELRETAGAFDSPLYNLQPYHGDRGVEEAVNLLGGLYQYRTKFGFNNSETHVFEMWFNGERATFYYIPEDVETGEEFRDQISEDYPDSNVRQKTDPYPRNDDHEMFEAGRAIAGARFDLLENPIFPLKSLENGGFGTRSRGATRDPYKDIIGPVTRDDSCQIMYQLVFCPTKRGRYRQWQAGRTARSLKEKQAVLLDERDPTKAEREAARTIEEQKSRDIFRVEMRLLVSAPTKQQANSRLDDIGNQINNRYRTNQGQQLYGDPASSYIPGLNSQRATNLASTMVNREFLHQSRIECTPEELAGLAHLPSDDVQNQTIDWTATRAGDPVPVGTPRMPWNDYDLDPMQLTPYEEQREMITKSGKGDPYWLGRGARKNTEVGIDPELLKLHMFVGGTTGAGKTTTLKNLFAQIMRRGQGGLFYDPKADDAKDFVSLVPEGREDDLIYIEIGGDREQQVGFNFLEIPGDPDPDTARFDEAVESLADDIEALLAQAGGDNDYWGPRMSRVVRNMARGMAKSGRQLTLLDMYYALIDEQGRQKYAQHLDDERIEWIVDYASRQLADMDDADIEPLIGRLQQWVESDLMRSIVSHPESTFSVEEAVAEGKIIIVRDDTGTGGTAGTMIATALIRRIWAAVQKRQQETEFEDPPMFYAILDEFDKIVSGQASVAEILSLARSFNLSMIPACQDLTNQLQGQDEIKNAILGQCNTFINFNPRREGEAREMVTRHDEDLTATDLTNIRPYRFYMRTENDRGEQTYSYKVDAFPPTDEVVENIARSEEEVEQLIERSLDSYAAERMTSEEIREESEFRSGGAGMDPEAMADVMDAGKNEETQRRDELFAAVDRAHIRNEKIGEFVSSEEIREAWKTVAGGDLGYISGTANQIEEADDEYLQKQRRNNDVNARLTPEGREVAGLVQDTGSSGSGGGLDHRWVLSQSKLAYERMGYTVSLPTQGEGDGELPDGIGLLPIDPTDVDELNEFHRLESKLKTEFNEVYEYSEGRDISIEAETSTITKPMQTMTNLRKAMESGMKCVFTTKDGSYDPEAFDDPDDEPDHANLFEYWARRGEGIMYADSDKEGERNDHEKLTFAREVDGQDNSWFYNKETDLEVDEHHGLVALRPAAEGSETVWREDGDEIVLASTVNGTEEIHARFGGPGDLADPPRESVPAYYEYDDSAGEYHVQANGEQEVYQTADELKANWTPVIEPFVPEIEFADENGEVDLPTPEDFEFVIFPDANNDEYDEPMVYKQGEVVGPLLPEHMEMPGAVVERDPESESEEKAEAEEASDGSASPESEVAERTEDAEDVNDSEGSEESEDAGDAEDAEDVGNAEDVSDVGNVENVEEVSESKEAKNVGDAQASDDGQASVEAADANDAAGASAGTDRDEPTEGESAAEKGPTAADAPTSEEGALADDAAAASDGSGAEASATSEDASTSQNATHARDGEDAHHATDVEEAADTGDAEERADVTEGANAPDGTNASEGMDGTQSTPEQDDSDAAGGPTDDKLNQDESDEGGDHESGASEGEDDDQFDDLIDDLPGQFSNPDREEKSKSDD